MKKTAALCLVLLDIVIILGFRRRRRRRRSKKKTICLIYVVQGRKLYFHIYTYVHLAVTVTLRGTVK